MAKIYKAEDILNYLETIDGKSFNQIYNQLDTEEREKVDEGIKEYTKEITVDSNWISDN